MIQSILAAGIVVGVLGALPLGVAYARAKRGWVDYRSAKSSVAARRKKAWVLTGGAVKTAIPVAVIAIAAIWVITAIAADRRGGTPRDRRDSPSPSVTSMTP